MEVLYWLARANARGSRGGAARRPRPYELTRPGSTVKEERAMRRVASFLFSLCLISGGALSFTGCGAAEDPQTGESSEDFRRGRHHVRRYLVCRAAYRQCLMSECRDEIEELRDTRPFSRDWFRQFEGVKVCAIGQCGDACASGAGGAGGTGGAGGAGGRGGSAGAGATGGTAGGSGVCSMPQDACQSCLCTSCETQVGTCLKDSACTTVFSCGMSAGCSGVDCYFAPDGGRGPCADEIDAAGGPASAAVAKALDVFRCAEAARPDCRVCTQ